MVREIGHVIFLYTRLMQNDRNGKVYDERQKINHRNGKRNLSHVTLWERFLKKQLQKRNKTL